MVHPQAPHSFGSPPQPDPAPFGMPFAIPPQMPDEQGSPFGLPPNSGKPVGWQWEPPQDEKTP